VWYETPVAVRVAIDVTPLIGVRTGVGAALAAIVDAFATLDEPPALEPYALSLRARQHRADLPRGTHFVPFPATVLLRSWVRRDRPRIDAFLGRADVVHATNYLAPPSRHPTLVTVYDCSFVRFPELCTPEVRAFEPALRRAIARGATVHTSSEFVAAEIDDIFGPGLRDAKRVAVVPLGVPALDAPARLPDHLAVRLGGAPYVLAIGTIEPRKNLPRLVRAFAAVAAAAPDALLVLAGKDGLDRDAVDHAIADLPPDVRARVVLTGPVDDGTRHALLDGAAVVAYPSLYEGFGFPVLEAMACHVPVVTARAGAIPEVAGDAAELVDPIDVDELGGALSRVLLDDARRADLVARGDERVRRFSWSSTARELDGVYRRLTA
jgi:glycosyltransferase involved in cell wall biosynthesis